MMPMYKKILFAAFIILAVLTPLAGAYAISLQNPLPNTNNLGDLIKNIARAVGAILLSLGTLFIFISGFLFMTSAGNPNKLETAKKALLYAAIGMIVGGLAEVIAAIAQSVVPTS